MKVNLTYQEFVDGVAGQNTFIYYAYDPKAQTMAGTFTVRAVVKGVTLEHMADTKPATFDVDFPAAIAVQGFQAE